ncbi:MAG: PilZ domain-containing protein [Planctomycetes bacterium]|nr:PilZ domain-containing protein [Planctomycetota bacterium]
MHITCAESGHESNEDRGPFRFERRQCDRWPVDGNATAFELGGENFGRMHHLRMQDYSDSGLCAYVDDPLTPGTTVSIGFQHSGYLARRGVVARCLPCGDGYRLAIIFEMRLAA